MARAEECLLGGADVCAAVGGRCGYVPTCSQK